MADVTKNKNVFNCPWLLYYKLKMEDGAVGHNFKKDPPRDHPCQVRFNLVQ
jgi:hypothetical protein